MKLGKRNVPGFYRGKQYFHNLHLRKYDSKVSGNGALSVTVKDFQAYSGHILEVVEISDANLDEVWIVAAVFSPCST